MRAMASSSTSSRTAKVRCRRREIARSPTTFGTWSTTFDRSRGRKLRRRRKRQPGRIHRFRRSLRGNTDRSADAALVDDAENIGGRNVVESVLVFLLEPLAKVFRGDEACLP